MGLAKCEINQSYTEEVPYPEVEYYLEQVPYLDEPYTKQYEALEPYTEEECKPVTYAERECSQENLVYSATDQKCYATGWLQNWTHSECTINNADSVGGLFKIYVGLTIDSSYRPPKGYWYKSKNMEETEIVYLDPGSSKTFSYSQQIKASRCYCYAQSISTKEVCGDAEGMRQECRNVTKYRTVTKYLTLSGETKYRTEVRNRSVTKYRPETRYNITEEAC